MVDGALVFRVLLAFRCLPVAGLIYLPTEDHASYFQIWQIHIDT